MRNYILVGLGPHAKRIYYPFLEKYRTSHNIRLLLLVELERQSSRVEQFIAGRQLRPEKILYLPQSKENLTGARLDEIAKKELDFLAAQYPIHGMIISTEPKAHKAYAEWALQHHINVLMDKPITAPLYPSTNIESAGMIFRDFCDLKHLLGQSRAKFYVMCQRRNHAGYAFIKKYLKDFTSEFEIPISFLDIYHADGAWSLPHEFYKENHPYKYGYGKLMHSGYHFIDLFSWLIEANKNIPRLMPDTATLYTARFSPNDLFVQIGEETYAKFFNQSAVSNFYRVYRPQDYQHFGELDVYVFLQLMHEGRVITTGSINLQQNSFSRRGWFELPEDTYKGNGRVRHERVNIQVSHFLNIQVHSYQSYESGKNASVTEPGETGSEDHFDILIFRNKKIVGGDSFLKLSVGKEMREKNSTDTSFLGHNERARETTFLNFIEEKDDASEFMHHEFTNRLLSNIYRSIAKRANGISPELSFQLQ